MKTRHICGGALASLALLMTSACTSPVPHDAMKINELPVIFPDYAAVTIPAEIAPLNFDYVGGKYDNVYVHIAGSKGGEIATGGRTIDIDTDDWHAITAQNKGGELSLTLSVLMDGKWREYMPFTISVSDDALDEWGLTYRRIAPGYECFGRMGLYQRELSSFAETPIIENTQIWGGCVNCHTSNRTNPDQMTFHIRGPHGGTLIQKDGRREVLKAKNDSIGGSMVYPYWHPDGNYCAFSTNTTRQGFHSAKDERIEVFDYASDVFVYDTRTHELILDTLLSTTDHMETYPAFAPDGRSLYFCSSPAMPIPEKYKEIRYDICRIAFDPATGTYGNHVDTLFRASAMGKSATHPRPSYDGRFLMFTMADYGCFPIWHAEADNWILDLQTGDAHPLSEANSPDTDSFHNWSTNSRWAVFTSRRDDGLYTKLYLTHIDANGQASKPFLLPQRNPKVYYDALMMSYNTPDFTCKPVDFSARDAGNDIISERRTPTTVRK